MSNTLPTILIIENDVATLDLYRRELSQDFDVITCLRKNEALETVYTQGLDAVVLEPVALNGQGWDLFNSILALPDHIRSFPVILCSVLDERKRGLELGAAVFLVKPVLPAQLMETLHLVIEKQRQPNPLHDKKRFHWLKPAHRILGLQARSLKKLF